VIATVQPWRELGAWQRLLRHPQLVIGVHFPAPVGRAPLVEILSGPDTGESAKRCVEGFAAMLGKVATAALEPSGGVINRVLCSGFAEALHLLAEGISAERVEQAMQRFGMVYTPLEHLDQMGLDEFALIARRLAPALGEAVAEHPVVRHMLEQRWLGMKTGVGFYRHLATKRAEHRPLASWLRRTFASKATPMSIAEQKKLVQARIVGRMVNQAFRCLDERVVESADQVDLALMLAGWAPHRGGPCKYAEQTGYPAMIGSLEELAREHGKRFEPAAGLRRRATTD
jgi:3-hydroxyacyl-CoA dehydrogenase/enoyl-CoA hydratase/3-hydroxybutyryl-CoA epimerase